MLRSTARYGMCQAALIAVVACGGTTLAPPGVDVTGRWVGSVDSTSGPPSFDPVFGTYTMTLQLTQSGANVTGTMTSDGSLGGQVAGGVSGRRIDLRITVAPCGGPTNRPGLFALTGNVREDAAVPATMDVTYQGTACEVADYGSGTLNKRE